MDNEVKQIFVRRLNTDKDIKTLEHGEYNEAEHVRIGTSSTDNINSVEPTQSNILRLIAAPVLGFDKCVGIAKDIRNNALIYCVYNSVGSHRIVRYYPETETTENIFPSNWNVSVLNWLYVKGDRELQRRLWNIRIVESGDDQLMFFTDGYNPPRRLNLNLKNYRTGAYVLTEDDLSVARKPPINLTWTFALDSGAKSNFIQDKFFQFRARYIYFDNEQSTWSPYSSLTIPPNDGIEYNRIDVQFNSGVKGIIKVEIAVRQGNGVSETGTTNPELYIFKTWEKGVLSDNTLFTVPFYNSEYLIPVARLSSDVNFSQVPQVAEGQEIVDSNQLILSDITEGYDNL